MSDYKLGIPGLEEVVPVVKGGTNIMLIGPPMSGKEVIANNILYSGLAQGESGILVTTSMSGEDALKWFKDNGLDLEPHKPRLGIVDCMSQTIGLAIGDTENIKRVSSPVNLTGISVGITNFFEDFWMKKQVRKARLCVYSLSTMLMYSNLQTVFRFLHVFTGRIKTADALGIYVVEQGMHDDATINTLKQLLDGVLEVKVENDSCFLRAMGMSQKPTKWYEYEVEGSKINIKYSYVRPAPP
ncbi:MAG: recombinase RecA [Euryarchaeota archaeon]|nr:recombinase RecA [Euryarchaeota archaeon]